MHGLHCLSNNQPKDRGVLKNALFGIDWVDDELLPRLTSQPRYVVVSQHKSYGVIGSGLLIERPLAEVAYEARALIPQPYRHNSVWMLEGLNFEGWNSQREYLFYQFAREIYEGMGNFLHQQGRDFLISRNLFDDQHDITWRAGWPYKGEVEDKSDPFFVYGCLCFDTISYRRSRQSSQSHSQ